MTPNRKDVLIASKYFEAHGDQVPWVRGLAGHHLPILNDRDGLWCSFGPAPVAESSGRQRGNLDGTGSTIDFGECHACIVLP